MTKIPQVPPSIYDPAPGVPPYKVLTDCAITRRKVHSIVEDSRGEICFRSRLFSDVVEWLAGEGETRYIIVTANGQFRASVERVKARKRPEK